MACDPNQQITQQDLELFKANIEAENQHVNSPNDTFIKPGGGTGITQQGIENAAAQQRQDIQDLADEAIDTYRRVNAGFYSSGPLLLPDKFTYAYFNGGRFYAVNPPYTTDPVTFPDATTDSNLVELDLPDEQFVYQRVNIEDSRLASGKIFPEDSAVLSLGAQSTSVDVNANIFKVNTGSDVEYLYLWEPSGTLPAAPFTITNISANSYAGYDFTINASVYEFVPKFNLYQRNICSVKGWGAVGDGVNDDYPASQKTADECTRIFFPDGDYLLSDSIVIQERNTRIYSDSLAMAKLIPANNEPAIILEDLGGVANVFVEIDHLRFSDNALGGGVLIRNRTRKVYIHHCRIVGLDYGIRINDSWSVFITQNHINDNQRNVSVYRTSTVNISPTTIYIFENSIMNFTQTFGYSISVGESGQPDFTAGEQCSTLVVEDNVMDGTQNYVQGATNTRWNKNHAEGGYPNTPHLLLDTTSSSFVFNANDNYIWELDAGIEIQGSNTRNVAMQRNYFRNITNYAIKADTYLFQNLDLSLNFYFNVGEEFLTSVRTSTNEAAEGLTSLERRKITYGGNSISSATALPTTGRYKFGDIVNVISGATGLYKFFPGGAATTALSYTNINASSFQAGADSGTNRLTPVDIFSAKSGDRITIPGAGSGGSNLDCVITTVDYVNGNYTTNPSIQTTVASANVSFTGSSDSNWYQIHSGSSSAGLDVSANGQDVAGKFNSERVENILAGGSYSIAVENRSAYLLFVRDTTNSVSNIAAIATAGLTNVVVSKLIDNGVALDVTDFGSNIVIQNTSIQNKDFAFTLIQLSSV